MFGNGSASPRAKSLAFFSDFGDKDVKLCQLDPRLPVNPIKLSSRTRLAAEVIEDETWISIEVRDPATWEFLDQFRVEKNTAIRQDALRSFVEV